MVVLFWQRSATTDWANSKPQEIAFAPFSNGENVKLHSSKNERK